MWNNMFLVLYLILFCSTLETSADAESDLDTYIVLLRKPEDQQFARSDDLKSWHQSFLPDTIFSLGQPRLVHSYKHVLNGFAAKLTAEEIKSMESKNGFISARPRRMVSLHTTHTPSFLGLRHNVGLWRNSNYGKGMIIGLVDSGIAADHPSFSGNKMPPPPAKWKGKCDNPTLCNNKLIGARNFATDSISTSDDVMHGTHTASTAAGSPVEGANYFGQANGTAVGMAPLAHLAMYKVSGSESKAGDSEILAAIDAAIEDGVDVLSLSLGMGSLPFYDDVIALGAFAAIRKGILATCSAGNEGPARSTLSNEAPWILTVGASTVDRAIRAEVLLGNDLELNGESLFQPNDFPSTLLPLVYPGDNGNATSARCRRGSLRNVDVKGKVVLCERDGTFDSQIEEVKDNGGAAVIVMNDKSAGFYIEPEFHMFPFSQVTYTAGVVIKAYVNSTQSPKATILFKGTVTGLQEAPQVADFSSRGPSIASPGILKPDIVAPGASILAAWPISPDNTTNRFAMISGTSMACPHVSGIAALLKSVHPNWSPAAIKSALMTTADLYDLGGKHISNQDLVRANSFDMGSGHVNPSRANDPGLIYDIQSEDYVPYLCGLGYTDEQVELIVQSRVVCSNESSIPEAELNYPSFSIRLGLAPKTYTRTVTNVGKAKSLYTAVIFAPQGVNVSVTPATLAFDRVNQKAAYSVAFSKTGNNSVSVAYGHLKWISGAHSVHSPIAIVFE